MPEYACSVYLHVLREVKLLLQFHPSWSQQLVVEEKSQYVATHKEGCSHRNP